MNKNRKIVNRRACFDYQILEKFEFGIVLYGWEVKSLRLGDATLVNAHLSYNAPHIMIHNMHIATYEHERSSKKRTADETERARIMLVHKKEKNKLMAASKIPGQTIVPLELYWNKRGLAKVSCAIVSGKKEFDKRATIKERDWQRQKQQILKARSTSS